MLDHWRKDHADDAAWAQDPVRVEEEYRKHMYYYEEQQGRGW